MMHGLGNFKVGRRIWSAQMFEIMNDPQDWVCLALKVVCTSSWVRY